MTPENRARLSLDGLSVGDAFGERFFGNPETVATRIEQRQAPPGPWRYTDDTEMAISVVEMLESRGEGIAFGCRFDSARVVAVP